MRSAFLIRLPFLLLLVAVARCQGPPPQMVNPHTQIRWPIGCNQPNMVYNFVANKCIATPDASALTPGPPAICANGTGGALTTTGCTLIPTQVTWPTTCTSGVYSPAANACVPSGTAANPAGASGEAQINLGGTFNAIPGSAPLSSNGMQYQGPLQSPNLIGTAYVNAPAAIGYRQNAGSSSAPSTAVAHNRDQTTAIFATPQDFCVNSGTGPSFDDTACFNKAIRWLASQNNNAAKTLYIPWTPNGYYLSNNNTQFLYTLPYDFGDYHGSAWYLTPASASVYFTNGKLTSCAIQAGTGYAPNAKLPIQILDPQHLGSGAAAYVLTDASGTPGPTCVIQLAGMNYPQIGVLANVIPLGGDGAAGTCALVSGAFTSPCTITSGGSGYNDGGALGPRVKPPANMAGLTCTTYPALTTTVIGTSVTAVTTTAGSVCTYAGNANATVPIQFGASCGGVQCTLLDPEAPINMPLSVAVLADVEIVGIGNPVINTDFGLGSRTSPALTDTIAFGDPWGDQAGGQRLDFSFNDMGAQRNIDGPKISGITVNAQIGFAFPYIGNAIFDSITCNKLQSGLCYYFGDTQQTQSGVFKPDIQISNNQWYGQAGIFVGGNWKSRGPDTLSGGSFGGTLLTHSPGGSGADFQAYGQTGGLNISNLTVGFKLNSLQLWDTFVEQYLWKAQNSPAVPKTDATHVLSNMATACVLGPGLSFASRATDANFGYTGTFQVYPWSSCYRGISGAAVSALSRYSFTGFAVSPIAIPTPTNYTFNLAHARISGAWRPDFIGYETYVDVSDDFHSNNNATADPYLPAGSVCGGATCTNAWIWLVNNLTGVNISQGTFTNINTGVGTVGLRSLFDGLSPDGGNNSIQALLVRNVTGSFDQSAGSTVTNVTPFSTGSGTSDPVAIVGMTARGRCQLTPTNASAATNIATTYVSAKTAGSITVTHAAVSGMTYDVACTRYF